MNKVISDNLKAITFELKYKWNFLPCLKVDAFRYKKVEEKSVERIPAERLLS